MSSSSAILFKSIPKQRAKTTERMHKSETAVLSLCAALKSILLLWCACVLYCVVMMTVNLGIP